MSPALPEPVRRALDEIRADASWLAAAEPELATTVVNLHLELRHLGLWKHVLHEDASTCGCFHVRVRDPAALRAALVAHPGMSDPDGPPDGHWQSRELAPVGALHIKHFDGWPEDRIQAHIDPWGIRMRSAWWWLLPLVPLGLLLMHAIHYHGYRDVARIRRILERQGIGTAEDWGT